MRYLSVPETAKFVKECKSRLGCYYVWPDKSNNYSGKDLPGALYEKVYDCSGFVTSSLYATTGTDWRATKNAKALAGVCLDLSQEELVAGDLVFYGAGPESITHVMVFIGYFGNKHGPVIGASGGTSKTLTPEIAKEMNAKVAEYSSIRYRPDVVSYGRIMVPK